MGFDSFLDRLNSSLSPCEVFSCHMRLACGKHRLACYAFDRYVRMGQLHDPHLRLNGHRMVSGPIIANRRIYDACMSDDGENSGQLAALVVKSQ